MSEAPLVLVADADAPGRKLVRAVLEAHGYRVLEAWEAGDAVALAIEHRPALVLLDLRLPGIEALEVRAARGPPAHLRDPGRRDHGVRAPRRRRARRERRRPGKHVHRLPACAGRCADLSMPRTIRELKAERRAAGFGERPGKGSHTVWHHPLVAQRIVLAGGDGNDARRYQERAVQVALAALDEARRRQV